MIYFIHDLTARSIKIGCSRDPRRRLSTLQISTSNELVLLGAIGGTERLEKKVHELAYKYFASIPREPEEQYRYFHGEWFDDRILPFVHEIIKSPKQFFPNKPKPADRPGSTGRDPTIHQGKLVLVFDSGEEFNETFILRAASPKIAMTALGNIANARLPFLAHTARVSRLCLPGCTSKKVSLQGAFVTQRCEPRDGLAVIFNSEPGNCYSTHYGVKQYANRWLHGVPDELCNDTAWDCRPTGQFEALMRQFAQALNRTQCVIYAKNPLVIRGLIPIRICKLPKSELRSKGCKKATSKRKHERPQGEAAPPKAGIVYFIQDKVRLSIKIGFCLKNPEKRLAALQTGNANALRLLGHVTGSSLDEKFLHVRFSGFRLHGEWFSEAIAEEVERIIQRKSMEEWLKSPEAAIPARTEEVTGIAEQQDAGAANL